MAKVIINSPNIPKRENLQKVYDLMNKIFYDDNLFYTDNELKKIKCDKSNVFIK